MALPAFPAPIFTPDFIGNVPTEVLALLPIHNTVLQAGFAAYKSKWEKIATRVPVDASGKLIMIAADRQPLMRLWQGDRVENPITIRSIDNVPLPYESTISIDKFQYQDTGNIPQLYDGVFMNWGMQMAAFPDALLANALAQATVTVGYDGSYICSTNHPIDPENPAAGTWSNNLVNTALTTINLATAIATFKTIPGRDGLPWSNRDGGISLVLPPQLEFAGVQAVQATMIGRAISEPSVGSGVTGVAPESNIYIKQSVDDVVVLQTLTDPNSWYLTDNKTAAYGPLILGLRQPFVITPMVAPTTPNVFNRHKLIWGVDGRMTISYTLPQNILRATSAAF
jgi:phage major head subunit gpT-like protein